MPDPEAIRLAQEWLQFAREDLYAARRSAADEGESPRHACFFAQQAAEKAIKSVLLLEQIDFPFVHDLVELQQLAPSRYAVRSADFDLAPLNPWATAGRYPGELDATESDVTQAVDLAARTLELVEQDFEREAAE